MAIENALPSVSDQEPGPGPEEATGNGPVVRVRHLRKTFKRADGTAVQALDDVSIDAWPGEFIVLLGPSGCGKTTLLRSLAGLEQPDSGRIDLHGTLNYSSESKVNLSPERRRLGMVFQSYALWPHMTAFANVAYPLRCQKVPKAEVTERAMAALATVGIAELAKQHPGQMSGGQQQRVALARALVGGDQLVLFDEPLSNVDAKVREQLRLEILSMQRQFGFCAVYVTHDQIEAMELADRVAVMEGGRIAQIGSPREIYERPTSRYVANFIGTTNELLGTITSVDGDEGCTVQTELGPVVGHRSSDAGLGVGDAVVIVCRPERCMVAVTEPAAVNRWPGMVAATMFVGSHTEVVAEVAGHRFRSWSADDLSLAAGQAVHVAVQPGHARVLPADAPDPTIDHRQTV